MLKLIRQYNQWILVVGGSLLLITFLMPSAIQNCAQQSAVGGAPWATYASGSQLTGEDLDRVRRELGIVDLLRDRDPNRDPLTRLGAHEDPAHWWMLTFEAQRAGLVGGEGEGAAVLASLAAAATAGGNPLSGEDVIRNIMRATGANRPFVLETTAKWRGVTRLLSLCESVDRMSDKRIEQFAAKSMLGLTGDLVMLDARTTAAIPAPEPTEARLEEHLRAYADKAPPARGGEGPFGYRIPDRVMLEWIEIPKSTVAALVEGSPELQSIALKKRFAQDPAKYGADPAMNPPFAAYEASVRSRTVDDLTKAKIDEITKFASDQLSLAQRSLKRRDSYFVLPENWSELMLSFEELAQSIATEFSVPAPAVANSGPALIELDAIGSFPGIGLASTSRFGSQLRTVQLVMATRELSKADPVTPIQARVASPALTDPTGNVYFFRVTAAEASRPARDLAEVRDAVVQDVLALERYEWLKANEAAIRSAAATNGVRSVADTYGVNVAFVRDLREFDAQFLGFGFRLPSEIPGLGRDPKALDALVLQASRLPFTSSLAEIPAENRTFVVLAPDRLALVMLQVTELSPASKETVESMRVKPEVARAAFDPTSAVSLAKLFSVEELSRRTGFKPLRTIEEDEENADEIRDGGATPASSAT
jgi:hypothetical protein